MKNNERTQYYWDSVAEIFKKDRSQYLWRCHSDAVNTELLRRWLPAERVKRILKTDLFDEAFGNGLYAPLASKAQTVVGIDLSASIVTDVLQCYADLQGTVGDIRCPPFTDGVFDVIISNSTLDHFTTQNAITASLREFHRLLKSKGQLILTLDNIANPAVAVRNALPFHILQRLGLVPYYVGTSLGPRRLSLTVKQVGFGILETSAIMHCPRILAIWMAHVLENYATPATQRRFLRALMAFERLERWKTRFFTGYFVAVRAIKL